MQRLPLAQSCIVTFLSSLCQTIEIDTLKLSFDNLPMLVRAGGDFALERSRNAKKTW